MSQGKGAHFFGNIVNLCLSWKLCVCVFVGVVNVYELLMQYFELTINKRCHLKSFFVLNAPR